MTNEELRPQVEAALALGVTELTETLAARNTLHALDDWRPGPDVGSLDRPSRWPDNTLRSRSRRQPGALAVFTSPSDRSASHATRALGARHDTVAITDVRQMDITAALDHQSQFTSSLWNAGTPVGGYVFLSAPDGALPTSHSFVTSEWAATFWSALIAFSGIAVNRPHLRSCVPSAPAPVTLDRSGSATTRRLAYATSDGEVTSSGVRYSPAVSGEIWIINGTPYGRTSREALPQNWIRRLSAYVASYGLSFAHAKVTNEDDEPTLLGVTGNPFSVTSDPEEIAWLSLRLAELF